MYCLVKTGFKDVSSHPNITHAPGDRIWVGDADQRARWQDQDLVQPILLEDALGQVLEDWPWGGTAGRDLRPWLNATAGGWSRVVACLNFWQDLPSLRETVPLWLPHVDRVVAFDGAYPGTPTEHPHSTDGGPDWLLNLDAAVTVINPMGSFVHQLEKRTKLLQSGAPGDLMFIVDADEFVTGADRLRYAPASMDVGWVLYKNPIYRRAQVCPRLFRWEPGLHYAKAHHWVWRRVEGEEGDGELIATHQLGGPGLDHTLLPVMVRNMRGINQPRKRIWASTIMRALQEQEELDTVEKIIGTGQCRPAGREPLRIVQLGRFDPGMVAYRLHSAINTLTPHESILGTGDWDRAYQEPHQFHLREQREVLQEALRGADVVHCHLSYHDYWQLGVESPGAILIHHHGTMYRSDPEAWNAKDELTAQVRLVSNMELLHYGEGLHYLPNPVPVAQYMRLRERVQADGRERDVFRVAHTPSKPGIKGTAELKRAVSELRAEGLAIECVFVVNVPHRDALAVKATADACFDSFDLGMQCSGLEAAAMGLPVLAGDPSVTADYARWIGYTPWTFVEDGAELKAALRRLVEDPEWRAAEAERVHLYVGRYHDYAPVMARYMDILDEELGWREKLDIRRFREGVVWR